MVTGLMDWCEEAIIDPHQVWPRDAKARARARLAELESRRIIPGLSAAEQNELRDCEITLGMAEAPPRARAEAARRVERFAAERATKKTPAQLQRDIDEVLAQKHRHPSHAEQKPLGTLDGMLDGTRITLTNAESLVRARVPDAFVDTHRTFQRSKKTYWIHRESSVASIGQGPTKKAAWKDAAYRLSLLPMVR
jgi:hypothetical protein